MELTYGDTNGLAWWKELNGEVLSCIYRSLLRIRLNGITLHNCSLSAIKKDCLHPIYSDEACTFGELILEPLQEIEIHISNAKDAKVFMSYTHYATTAKEELDRVIKERDRYSSALKEDSRTIRITRLGLRITCHGASECINTIAQKTGKTRVIVPL